MESVCVAYPLLWWLRRTSAALLLVELGKVVPGALFQRLDTEFCQNGVARRVLQRSRFVVVVETYLMAVCKAIWV